MSIVLPVSIDRNQDGTVNFARGGIVISDDDGDIVCIVPTEDPYRRDLPADRGDADLCNALANAETLVETINRGNRE